jgi:serine/threonine protein kinase
VSSETDLGIPGISDAEVIGQGGFSVVYAATDTRFARRVAVKVLGKLISESDRRRFDRECQVMGQLSSHPNVVTVFSGGYAANDHPYLIMELVEGGTLADRLDAGGPIPWREAIDYVIPVADALGTGHRRQPAILHRDVKPENILLAGDHAKLTDFGIAYLRDATGATSTHITASWLHTPPETFENERDARSDIYSLVSTLFTLIAGDPPFWRHDDESLSPLMRRLMIEPAPPLDPALGPPELRDLLRRGLAKDPGERPQTATERWVRGVCIGLSAPRLHRRN